MARVPVDGLERMRALVAELPTMLVDGFRTGREVALPFDDSSSSRLYACGLGGSGAAADLAGWNDDEEQGDDQGQEADGVQIKAGRRPERA